MKKNAVILSVDVIRTASGYHEYLDTLRKIEKSNAGLELLGENVWLIHLPCGLPSLSRIVSVCEFASFAYKLLHIDHDPVWVSYGGNKSDISQR